MFSRLTANCGCFQMVMTGLIGLLGRGSIFQVFCATVISFLFFATSLHAKPFDSAGLNIVKIVSEFQLLVIEHETYLSHCIRMTLI